MIKELIKKVVEKQDLTRDEAKAGMKDIMSGEATPSQIASFITALRMKGETIEEITGCAEIMRENSIKINPKVTDLVDTCGTGGDVSGTFNISTLSAIIASAAGVPIAKHGNRSVSSKCGSADILEALGVNIILNPEQVEKCIETVGFGFIFAPNFHPAMKYAMPSRKETGIRTIFNILGPLTNPASAKNQLLGVFSESLTEVMATVLQNLGSKQVMVVHGMDKIDEISISDRTKIAHLKNDTICNYFINPEQFSMKARNKEDIRGGSSDENIKITHDILKGTEKGAKRDVVLLNSAAAIVVGNKAKDIKEGIGIVEEVIDSGKALKKLEDIIKFTKEV